MPKTADVVVIGGGVVGCSIAYQLASRGIKSTVLERARLASGASGATAGVVAPLWHLDHHNDALFSLGLLSLRLFPALAGELLEAGIDPQFRSCGVLKLAWTSEQVEELQNALAWQGGLGLGVTWLEPGQIFDRETAVSREVLGGVFSPREGCVRGQAYVEALAHAAGRRGATVLEGEEVLGLEKAGRRITGVRTATETYHCGHTVLAAGPWTAAAGGWLAQELPVRPVKGQRVLLRKPGFLLGCPVRSFDAYVVPQLDGNLLVGATREEGVFNEQTTAGGVRQMLSAAVASFPVLKDATFIGARAGVRPGSPDGVPIMGPVPGWEGISIASGHDQVGIMLSPGTGELMASYIAGGGARNLEPFSLSRFGAWK
jgi:glycine oxidase